MTDPRINNAFIKSIFAKTSGRTALEFDNGRELGEYSEAVARELVEYENARGGNYYAMDAETGELIA